MVEASECPVCLTETQLKNVCVLHLDDGVAHFVCAMCAPKLDKCPLCRAPIKEIVTLNTDDAGPAQENLERQQAADLCFSPPQRMALTLAEDGGTLTTLNTSADVEGPEVVVAFANDGPDYIGLCAVYVSGADLVIAALDNVKLRDVSYSLIDESMLLLSNISALRALPHLSSSTLCLVCQQQINMETPYLNARLRDEERALVFHHAETGGGKKVESWTDNAAKLRLIACMRRRLSSGNVKLDSSAVSANPQLAQALLSNADRLRHAARALATQAASARVVVRMPSQVNDSAMWTGEWGVRRPDCRDETLMAFAIAAYVASEHAH